MCTKIARCSDPGSRGADALSKADFAGFYKLMPDRNIDPVRIPRMILKWLMDPTDALDLGEAIGKEMAARTKLLGY